VISALDEDPAFAMCGGCPVPEEVRISYCHKWTGARGLAEGNLCLLREIQRNQPAYSGPSIRMNIPRRTPSLATRARHHEPKKLEMLVDGVQVTSILIRPTAEDLIGLKVVSVSPSVTYRSGSQVNMTEDLVTCTVKFTGVLWRMKWFLKNILPNTEIEEDGR